MWWRWNVHKSKWRMSSFLTLDGILHMLLLHIINLDLTMLIEKQKQLLWDMWESVQHSDLRKDTMNKNKHEIADNPKRLSPNYLDQNCALFFIIHHSYHPEIHIPLLTYPSQTALFTNNKFFRLKKEPPPQIDLREYSHSWAERVYVLSQKSSLWAWMYTVHWTLNTPHKKYIYLLNDNGISWNELHLLAMKGIISPS